MNNYISLQCPTIFEGCIDSNYKFYGSDIPNYKSEKAENPEDCQKLCQDNGDCKFWTLSENHKCYLKNVSAPGGRIHAIGAFSGTVDCPGIKPIKTHNW